jgi:hypothetical protein
LVSVYKPFVLTSDVSRVALRAVMNRSFAAGLARWNIIAGFHERICTHLEAVAVLTDRWSDREGCRVKGQPKKLIELFGIFGFGKCTHTHDIQKYTYMVIIFTRE